MLLFPCRHSQWVWDALKDISGICQILLHIFWKFSALSYGSYIRLCFVRPPSTVVKVVSCEDVVSYQGAISSKNSVWSRSWQWLSHMHQPCLTTEVLTSGDFRTEIRVPRVGYCKVVDILFPATSAPAWLSCCISTIRYLVQVLDASYNSS